MSDDIDDNLSDIYTLANCKFAILHYFYEEFINTTQDREDTKKNLVDYVSGFRVITHYFNISKILREKRDHEENTRNQRRMEAKCRFNIPLAQSSQVQKHGGLEAGKDAKNF